MIGMLTLELSDFLIQLKEGSVNNVGSPTKSASVKLYDVTEASARPFGDNRVKLLFEDDSGNRIDVAVFPEEAAAIIADLEAVKTSGSVDGFD